MFYNITIIRPRGFAHSSGFNEVAESLAWALTALGYDATITQNWISNKEDETNIVFGAELLAPTVQLPRNTIIFNLEQPTHPNMEKVRQLARGLRVWDYSKTNVETWQAAGYNVRHVPIGYTPNLTRIPKTLRAKQDIDVLFVGFLTPRRKAVIDELRAAGLKVTASDRCYGGGRDNLISRARIVLNCHHDGRSLFEIVRVSYLLANSKCVVSEVSADDGDYSDLAEGLVLAPYEGLVDACMTVVASHKASLGFDRFSRRDFVATVKTALETPDESLAERRYRAGCASGDMKDFLPFIRERAKGTCLEIGVRDGASTSAFLLGLEKNGGVLCSIDIADCSQLFAGHPAWKFIRASSQDPKLHFPPLDVVLIDGDHTREGYRADLEKFYPLVNPGGLILSHDIAPEPGQTLEDVPGSDYPSVAVREEYFAFAEKHGLEHFELPGKYGFGVLVKPA